MRLSREPIGDRKRGFIASPTLQYAVRTQGAGARLHVQITEERLNRQLLRWRPTLKGGADMPPSPAFEKAIRKAGFSTIAKPRA